MSVPRVIADWMMVGPVIHVHACPVCSGQGTVSRPPWIAGDQETWVATGTALYPCHACNGKGWIKTSSESPPQVSL